MTRAGLVICFLPLYVAAPALAQGSGAIFQRRIPSEQLAFLRHFDGARSGDLLHEKAFNAILKNVVPDCTFHYGWDMSFSDAVDLVLKASPAPVSIRDGRYLTVSGQSGPYLGGRGFLWFDLQSGVALGAFFFHPTNGEPTPTVTVFSKQVRKEPLGLGELPLEFARDLRSWSQQDRIAPVTTRYFVGATNKRILLEHDEDFCMPLDGNPAPAQPVCDQMNADAADADLTAAYYLQQVHFAANATAWMIVPEEHLAWIRIRDNTCHGGPEPLRCRIRMTRERVRTVVDRRASVAHGGRR